MTDHKITPAQVRELRCAEGIIFRQHNGQATVEALTPSPKGRRLCPRTTNRED